MTTPPPSRGVPDDKYRQPADAQLGGADAVEKTTYVTGSGTEPERRGSSGEVRKGAAGTGPNATLSIIIFLLVGAVLVYVLGWGR